MSKRRPQAAAIGFEDVKLLRPKILESIKNGVDLYGNVGGINAALGVAGVPENILSLLRRRQVVVLPPILGYVQRKKKKV